MSAEALAGATGDHGAAAQAMDADRFRDLRIATGLTYRQLAEALRMRGKHAATHLREMNDGVRAIPGPTGVALQALADGWRPDRPAGAAIVGPGDPRFLDG